jgi:predicted ATPase
VGIYGPPGVGKSALARSVAAAWIARDREVAFVDARATRDFDTLFDALVHALSMPPVAEFEREEVFEQLARALRERSEILVVLDDVERVRPQVAALLTRLQAAPGLRAVVTSRVPVEGVELLALPLRPLEEDAAVALFEARARRARPELRIAQLDANALRALIQQLDRLPLAIELAAARLAIMTPQALLTRLGERLGKRLQLLRPGHAAGARAPMALEEAISISWEMLDAVQKSVLSQCTVFEGGFELAAAEEVVAIDDEKLWVGDVLQSLVLQSLLVTSHDEPTQEMRFTLLESIQEFALAHGDDTQLDGARRRHSEHFYERGRAWAAQVRGQNGEVALACLIGESANINAACERLAPAKAAALTLALEPTFEVRGLLGSYLERIDIRRKKCEGSDGVWPHAREAITRARLLSLAGRLQEALAEIEPALESTAPSTPLRSEALLQRGRILRALGRLQEARADWSRGVEECDSPFWRFQLQNELGLLELNSARFGTTTSGDEEDALARGARLLAEAYELACRNTHALYRARPAVGWALALHETGETARATRLLADELEKQIAAGYRNGELLCRHHMAMLEFYATRYDRALELADEVDHGLAQAGLTARRARNLSYAAIYANAAGRLDEAADFIARALDAAALSGQEVTALVADVQGLMVAWERGDEDTMHAHLDRGRKTADSVGSPGHAAFLDAYEALLLAADGRLETARELGASAIERLRTAAEYRGERGDHVARAWEATLDLSATHVHLEAGRWSRVYEALGAVDGLADLPEDALTAVARRHAQLAAERARADYNLPEAPPSQVLRIGSGGHTFQLGDHDPVDLSRRAPLRRVLGELVERACDGQSSADVDALVAAGWPGEALEPTSAANRVYATIRMLRKQGLDDIIVTDDDGYRLAEGVWIRSEPDS